LGTPISPHYTEKVSENLIGKVDVIPNSVEIIMWHRHAVYGLG